MIITKFPNSGDIVLFNSTFIYTLPRLHTSNIHRSYKRKWFHTEQKKKETRSKRCIAKTMTGVDYTNDLALFVDTPTQTDSLLLKSRTVVPKRFWASQSVVFLKFWYFPVMSNSNTYEILLQFTWRKHKRPLAWSLNKPNKNIARPTEIFTCPTGRNYWPSVSSGRRWSLRGRR